MIGTEEEARQWWCPMARAAFQYREGAPDAMVVCNRAENDHPIGNCIASKCAMWRWEFVGYTDVVSGKKFPGVGFCGLAGKS